MNNGLRIAAIAALALGVAACGKSASTNNAMTNVSAADNMLAPVGNGMTDMNAMGGNSMAMDNMMLNGAMPATGTGTTNMGNAQ
ncbi:MAG TPA: hypothetical protein VFL92_01925 [Sphingomonas sp.]|nr:hypothetical protein [Sphingomonas sp.]